MTKKEIDREEWFNGSDERYRSPAAKTTDDNIDLDTIAIKMLRTAPEMDDQEAPSKEKADSLLRVIVGGDGLSPADTPSDRLLKEITG